MATFYVLIMKVKKFVDLQSPGILRRRTKKVGMTGERKQATAKVTFSIRFPFLGRIFYFLQIKSQKVQEKKILLFLATFLNSNNSFFHSFFYTF